MLALDTLVDSSFFIAGLRAKLDPLVELIEASRQRELYKCGVFRVEVMRGMRSPQAKSRMKAFFDRMCYIPATNAIWEHAEQLARDLDRTGKIIQVTDLTIACCALQREVAVLTFDGDFNRVPGLRVLSSIE